MGCQPTKWKKTDVGIGIDGRRCKLNRNWLILEINRNWNGLSPNLMPSVVNWKGISGIS